MQADGEMTMNQFDAIFAQLKNIETSQKQQTDQNRKIISGLVKTLQEIAAIRPSEGDNSGRLAVQIAQSAISELDL
jgi:hypothetical protein